MVTAPMPTVNTATGKSPARTTGGAAPTAKEAADAIAA